MHGSAAPSDDVVPDGAPSLAKPARRFDEPAAAIADQRVSNLALGDRCTQHPELGNDLRILRRLDVREGPTGVQYDGGETFIGLVLDVETTGRDPAADVVIELALRRFRHDLAGRILKIDRPWSWREDPGRPLPGEVARLTGLTDADLAGCHLDEELAVRLLRSADLVIAHNAGFDRKFVERRLPEATGLPWACTCVEVDWAAAGFDGRALGWLTAQAGWFYDPHRAMNDVDAVVALLGHVLPDGRSVLADLLDSAACPSVRVEAVGADFHVKDALRARGYRWDAADRVWCREIAATDLMDEEFWLARNVYAAEFRPRAMGPRLTEVTARERYA